MTCFRALPTYLCLHGYLAVSYTCPGPLAQRQQLSQGSLKKKKFSLFYSLVQLILAESHCLCSLCQSHVQELHLVLIKWNLLLNTPLAESISFTCCGTITPEIVHYFFSLRVTKLPVGEKTYSYRQGACWSKAKDKRGPEKRHSAKQQQKGAGEVNWDGKSWECQETDAVIDKREAWTALSCGLSNPHGADIWR